MTEDDIDHRGWYYAGVRKCEWCDRKATRASHDGCYFCESCALPWDMRLTEKPTGNFTQGKVKNI